MKQRVYRSTDAFYLQVYRMLRAVLASRALDFKARQFYAGIARYMRAERLVTERQALAVRRRYVELRLGKASQPARLAGPF
jgi:hypothetical protein